MVGGGLSNSHLCELLSQQYRETLEMATATRLRLGKVIKDLRKKRNWRQIDLAAHSDINKTMICDLERGERDFCLKTLDALAEALDTLPSELLRAAGR